MHWELHWSCRRVFYLRRDKGWLELTTLLDENLITRDNDNTASAQRRLMFNVLSSNALSSDERCLLRVFLNDLSSRRSVSGYTLWAEKVRQAISCTVEFQTMLSCFEQEWRI